MDKSVQKFLNSPVSNVADFRGKNTGDLFGVEVECEGRNVRWEGDDAGVLNDWSPEHDGSLRENGGMPQEWIFKGPVNYEESQRRIHSLFNYLSGQNAEIRCSNRTSVHVHFNMADKNAYQVINLFILFTILEDILDDYCGEERNGNLFCLSSRRAEQQVDWVERACFENGNFFGIDNNLRYCSLNLASLNKFGSVEFRAMSGVDNRDSLLDWLSIVNELCTYACYSMHNPVDLIQDISMNTSSDFLSKIFSDRNVDLLTHGLDEVRITDSIYEGVRLIQMLAYKVGAEFEGVRVNGKDFWAELGDGDKAQKVDYPVPPVRGAEMFIADEGAVPRNLEHHIEIARRRMQAAFRADLPDFEDDVEDDF